MEKLAAKPVQEAVAFLRKMSPEVPSAAIILGSGVKALENLDESNSVSYDEVFGISPGVVGHSGTLSLGKVGGKLVAVLRGRFHCYEGHPWDVVTLPAQVLVDWGVPELYVTNAAGGINQSFNVGDLMILTGYRDHLNNSFRQTGLLTQIKKAAVNCSNKLTDKLVQVSAKLHKQDQSFKPLQAGTYIGLLGPNYETLAEVELLKYLNCDAVGMSTVPELITCHGTKTIAAGLSVITNVWKPDEAVGGHEEVLTAAKLASEQIDKLFREAIHS
ncbi:MAG: purine-nucleoside phosphorylase [Candidatus Obscuribacterales bacterium]|nr:purine-nucleoside phosphorylase [Candidatus Obscuribacterales bacterium]